MFSRCTTKLSALIPREAWDPQHHNPKWVDSYAEPIAVRREWPARQWLVGLNPKSQKEFLGHSMRNLAYEYNAALRACGTFPEMVPYYKEMIIRGVKLDVDTMYVLLSRAARCPTVSIKQIFLLWDEMRDHGARPDLATTEVLQTVLKIHEETSDLQDYLKSRKAELVQMYSVLCVEEMHRLGCKKYFSLVHNVFHRCRENASLMHDMLDFACYATYASYLVEDPSRTDTLSFSGNTLGNLDAAVFSSPAITYTAEGLLLAFRYDLERRYSVQSASIHRSAESSRIKKKDFNQANTCILKNFLAAGGSEANQSLRQNIVNVYQSVLDSSILRYGTHDAVDTNRILYFCKLLWADISWMNLGACATKIFEALLEVFRFYDKEQASASVIRYLWTRKLMSAKALAHYIATANVRTFDINLTSQDISTGRLVKLAGRPEKCVDFKDQYERVKKFALDCLKTGCKHSSKSQVMEILTALLWFVRRAMTVHSTAIDLGNEAHKIAMACVEDIHAMRNTLMRGIDLTANRDKKFEGDSTRVGCQSNSNCASGDYIDALFDLLDIIAKGIHRNDAACVLKFRANLIKEMKNDESLMAMWMEEC